MAPVRIRLGAFTLDIDARQLTGDDGRAVHLSPKAFDLLTMLVEQRPAVIERTTLRQRLWPDVHVVDAALTNLIAEIRAALKDADAESPLIRTVHGVGYAAAADAPGPAVASEPAAATRCWLVWRDRPIVLSTGPQIIGRDAASDVWIDAEGVSRRHARLRITVDAGGEWRATIEDLSSTNGTHVQGRRISKETALQNGDRIHLGDATIVFRAAAAGGAPTKRVSRKR